MAGAWCLPKPLAEAFVKAIHDGSLDIQQLTRASSDERRAEFAKIVGDDNARMVNEQFEAKILLKNRKAGLLNWAKKLTDVSEPVRKDIVAQIQKLDRVLNPAEEKAFLADLAAKKLGVTVTSEEARQIFELSQNAEKLRAEIVARGGNYRDGWTAESGTEYALAEQALINKINDLKPRAKNSDLHNLENILALSRELETGPFHFSAPGVQGYGMVSHAEFWTGIGKMFQFFASDRAYERYQAYMRGHPDFEFVRGGGLGLTKVGEDLSKREEDIQSSLLEGANQYLVNQMTKVGITGMKNLMSGFSHAFTGYLNYLRFETATKLLTAARLRGEDITPTSEATHDIMQYINNFTGRAELGYRDKMGNVAAPANMILYTVRKNVATFQMFNPYEYLKPQSPTARMAKIRSLVGMIVFTGAVTKLASMAGAKVSFNPDDSDFMKIDIGGEKIDLGGANASYIRFLSRMFTGREVTGGVDRPADRGRVLLNFARGKLAPNAGMLIDRLAGTDIIGRPFSASQEIWDHYSPIFLHSFMEYALNNPEDTAAFLPALSSILGVGLESPEPPLSRSGNDVFGDPLSGPGSPKSWRDDPVVKAAREADFRLNFPPNKITGVTLTDAQYDEYAKNAGRLAHQRLSQLIENPSWQTATKQQKQIVMKATVDSARRQAAHVITIQSIHTDNDIMKQAAAAKLALHPPGLRSYGGGYAAEPEATPVQ